MKTSLATICLSLLLLGARAQDPPNSIKLRKEGQRDWVKDYKNLKKKHEAEVDPLNDYFLDENGADRKYIDYKHFKKLVEKAKQVLKPLGSGGKRLLEQIERIDKANPNGFMPQKGKATQSEPDAKQSETAQAAPEEAVGQDSSPPDVETEGQILPSEQEELINRLNEDLKQLKSDKQFWVLISNLLGVLLAGTCVVLLWLTVFKKRLRSSSARSQPNRDTISVSNQLLERKSNALVDELTTRIKQLEKENGDLKTKLASRPTSIGNPQPKGRATDGDKDPQAVQSTVHNQPLTNDANGTKTYNSSIDSTVSTRNDDPPVQFHLSTPTPTSDGMGTFSDKRQMQFDPIKSVYRFEITDRDGNQATFSFESSAGAVSGAIDYPETYLQPACEYSSFDSRATRILTDKKGRAVKDGDKWRVTQKAQIRFT